MIYEINHIWTGEMKWKWRNDHRSECNLCNCVKKPEKKIQDFNGVQTHDLAIPVRCSTNWAMTPLTLGAGQFWVHMFPWRKWVLMIYEINGLLMTFLRHSSTFIKTMPLMKCSCFKRLDQLLYSTWVSRFLVVWLLSRVK